MRPRRIVAIAAAAVTAAAVLTIANPAQATFNFPHRTFETAANFGLAHSASAFDISAKGILVNASKTLLADCTHPGTHQNKSIQVLNASPLLNITVPKASCAVHFDGSAQANATIASVTLLGLKFTAIESRCSADGDGSATVGSVEATAFNENNYTKNGEGGLVIPGVAVVYFNNKITGPGRVTTIALTIEVLPHIVNGQPVSAQEILIGGCTIAGPIGQA